MTKRTVFLLLLVAACDTPDRATPKPPASEAAKATVSEAPKPAPSAPTDPRAKSLADSARAILSAVAKGPTDGVDVGPLLAPQPKVEAWFRTTFGPKAGDVLMSKWQEGRAKDPRAELIRVFKEAKVAGAADVQVLVVDTDESPSATTPQKAALKIARDRLVLYTVRFTKADGTKVKDLWSFAAIDGVFADVGPMTMALELNRR